MDFADVARRHAGEVYRFLLYLTGDRDARRGPRGRRHGAGVPFARPLRPRPRDAARLAARDGALAGARPLPAGAAPAPERARAVPTPTSRRRARRTGPASRTISARRSRAACARSPRPTGRSSPCAWCSTSTASQRRPPARHQRERVLDAALARPRPSRAGGGSPCLRAEPLVDPRFADLVEELRAARVPTPPALEARVEALSPPRTRPRRRRRRRDPRRRLRLPSRRVALVAAAVAALGVAAAALVAAQRPAASRSAGRATAGRERRPRRRRQAGTTTAEIHAAATPRRAR